MVCFICREKIHGFEYPPGQRIIVKPLNEMKSNHDAVFSFDGKCGDSLSEHDNEMDSNAGASKDTFSSVPLPPPAPLANPTSQCAQRCFVVCVPKVACMHIPTSPIANNWISLPSVGTSVEGSEQCVQSFRWSDRCVHVAKQKLRLCQVCQWIECIEGHRSVAFGRNMWRQAQSDGSRRAAWSETQTLRWLKTEATSVSKRFPSSRPHTLNSCPDARPCVGVCVCVCVSCVIPTGIGRQALSIRTTNIVGNNFAMHQSKSKWDRTQMLECICLEVNVNEVRDEQDTFFGFDFFPRFSLFIFFFWFLKLFTGFLQQILIAGPLALNISFNRPYNTFYGFDFSQLFFFFYFSIYHTVLLHHN